jgi:hypothetical protein
MSRNHFLSIWTRPRETIRAIVAEDPRRHVLVLAMLSGIAQALDRASLRHVGDRVEWPVLAAVAVVGGSLFGILSIYLVAVLLRLTGSWLGGRADHAALRAAMAWASIPVIATLLLWPIQIGLFGMENFSSITPRIDASPMINVAFAGISLILGVWSFVLALKTIGEVHGFSAWRALGSVLIASVIAVAVVVAFVFALTHLLQ